MFIGIFNGELEKKEVFPRFTRLPRIFFTPVDNIMRDLQRLQYLGPLRAEPQRAYLHSGSPSLEICQKGENAAQILWIEKDKKFLYLPDMKEKSIKLSLSEAVNDAFKRIGIKEDLNITSEKYDCLSNSFKFKRFQQEKSYNS